ncbi:leucine-rich repeat serine/threonine-protein kinase 1 [Diachasmimorpha longicaudata]|uniref:leucine-rich repeat serine/threonine-protein kinase 1 n=1 Tax=Diachasmimorpha longicaudata TaxID=58733 RepID=UPI0030B8E5B9
MEDYTPVEEDFPGRLLHQAALWDNAELLEDLLRGDHSQYINSQDSWGRTALHAAAITENSRCLVVLLSNGANPNIPCGPRGQHRTALHICTDHGHSENISKLLEHHVDLAVRDSNGLTPEDIAAKNNDKQSISLLVEASEKCELLRLATHASLRAACLQGDTISARTIIQSSSECLEAIVNMAPNGANTLLFITCEMGHKDIVRLLLDHGADCRSHPVTKYTPLYIACYNGKLEIVDLLLRHFPKQIQSLTVERWLPIHAATINGHAAVVDLLLRFEYPQHMCLRFKDPSGEFEYDMPFDINTQDVTGQNVLYIASMLGNLKIVETLLGYKVKSVKINEEEPPQTSEQFPIAKRRISTGIQRLMSSLNFRSKSTEQKKDDNSICPLQLDIYCNNSTETALHTAVKAGHTEVVAILLQSGSNPNLPIKTYTRSSVNKSEGETEAVNDLTLLTIACHNRDVKIADLLLKYGAVDNECRALKIAAQNGDEILTAKLLSIKAHPDPDYKINKKAMTEGTQTSHFSALSSFGNVTYPSLFPNTPTMINWHDQQCRLSQIRIQWLIDAVLHVNKKLSGKNNDLALYAITRIDISHNSITTIPSMIFYLQSLKYLNMAQNKIDTLTEKLETDKRPRDGRDKLSPVLEEMYLQDNRLEKLPEFLMILPALEILDVSNNKLQRLPDNLWRAPKLKELNASFNLLRDLPSQVSQNISTRREMGLSSTNNFEFSSRPPTSNSTHEGLEITAISRDDSAEFDSFTKLTNAQIIEMDRPHVWTKSVRVSEKINDDSEPGARSVLTSLNLAHNLFNSIPVALPCLAVSLVRLNMAYNSLRSMSHITSYPASLKQLDLSNNQISCWPSLPQVDPSCTDSMEQASTACYCPSTNIQSPIMNSVASNRTSCGGASLRDIVLMSVCNHRRHLRLENLRTLVLANNLLTRIQLTSVDDGENILGFDESGRCYYYSDGDRHSESDRESKLSKNSATMSTQTHQNQYSKLYLLFPNVSMLDVSNNSLKEIPQNIYELSNLSVLNISGNIEISELPPQMGLLSRLWNLNTQGCKLQEPLKTMIESKKYKTMDVVGYLKSILEDAKPYARMKLMIVGIQGIGKTSLLEQLRQEGEVPNKKRSAEHWAKRMGNKNINTKTARGTTISTVGVDIGDWVYEKKVRGQSSHGAVYFRTWDFGGQKEYYATHQYFLSKRSLYLVVWKITDGFKGVFEIFQWLVNIQSRAPNSPVIIVGTHYDVSNEQSEVLQQYIRDKFINVVDAEKCGLPKVMETIEVSCKTRHNIKMLCNLIYDVVFSLKSPGSKELLLEQRVPASYLALEDVVVQLAHDRKLSGADPVLRADQYYAAVNNELQKLHKSFRDLAELHQATLFLHENGIILHYDDATLKDLYFLDPQWLCDMLAHVVTIREINPFARAGIMKLDDIQHVFKSSTISSVDTQGYIVSLLNKFEVALTWDYRTLLIPSLLPTEEDIQRNNQIIKIPLKSRGWHVRTKKITSPTNVLDSMIGDRRNSRHLDLTRNNKTSTLTSRPQPDCSVTRLLLMSYFPSGFWSRLITRILADDTIVDIVMTFITPFKDFVDDNIFSTLLDNNAEWIVWQTGLELRYAGITLLRLKEVNWKMKNAPYDYRQLKFMLKQDGTWCSVDLKNSAILEIWFPVDTLVIKQPIMSSLSAEGGEDEEPMGYQAIVVEPRPESMPQLLALIVDHIDILLEDWYPTLGTRFVHTSEGKLLVTRLIPCPRCLLNATNGNSDNDRSDQETSASGGSMEVLAEGDEETSKSPDDCCTYHQHHERQSQDSCKSDGDSGVGYDSSASSRMPSLEGHPDMTARQSSNKNWNVEGITVYSWMVEECILSAYSNKTIACPKHLDIPLSHVAPDIIFMDLGARHLIKSDDIKRGRMLGRGAFGFVFKGTCKVSSGTRGETMDVAMKMLQPVPPGPNSKPSAVLAYKAAQSKWDRDPLQYACKAYCTARQELNILLTLRHTNIVPLIGIVISPLALVLDLAPEGALDNVLKNYRRSGAKLDPHTLQSIILQVAKAVEYLHQQHVIYRDLKSENVLVWMMPQPHQHYLEHPVHVKVADYGISRLTLPSGAKGFGGTEGFMAPEIIKYNGEEEYTEKVDSFSFGMFIYELVTLRQPFEGHEAVKECILEGGRPPLSYRETLYPCYVLDLMVICWAQNPKDRPTASQIVSIASAPEFTHLIDVTLLTERTQVTAITATSRPPASAGSNESFFADEIWLGHNNGEVDMLLGTEKGWLQHVRIETPVIPYAMSGVDGYIWIGDNAGQIHVYLATNFGCVASYYLESDQNLYRESKIVGLIHLESIKHFAVALHSGKIYLLTNNFTQMKKTEIVKSVKENIKTYSLAAVHRRRRIIELWVGQSFGGIAIYVIKENGNLVDTCEVVHIQNETSSKNLFATYLLSAETSVLSYTYPGCIVYQWDVETRQIINKLDMSKLVPCSESLKSISIEENFTTERCQVTALEVCMNQLYIGTTWGCIAVAECNSLRPITVFRPFEGKVSEIVALKSPDKKRLTLATVGQGYRSLISRYTDYPIDCLLAEDLRHNMYTLLWRAENWSAA